MNNYYITIALVLFSFANPKAQAEENTKNKDISASEQLLNIVSLYLKSASSGDYRPMAQFADPNIKQATIGRGGPFCDSKGKEIPAYWYISSIKKRPDADVYDIVLECYASADGVAQSTSVHAVAEGRKGRYVLTEW